MGGHGAPARRADCLLRQLGILWAVGQWDELCLGTSRWLLITPNGATWKQSVVTSSYDIIIPDVITNYVLVSGGPVGGGPCKEDGGPRCS